MTTLPSSTATVTKQPTKTVALYDLIASVPRDVPDYNTIVTKYQYRALQFVPPSRQTEHMCLHAMQHSLMHEVLLKWIHKQTPAICLAAVQNNGHALQHVRKQTPELCLAAVQNNGYALQYVRKQTPEICIAAFKQTFTSMTLCHDKSIDIPPFALMSLNADDFAQLEIFASYMHSIIKWNNGISDALAAKLLLHPPTSSLVNIASQQHLCGNPFVDDEFGDQTEYTIDTVWNKSSRHKDAMIGTYGMIHPAMLRAIYDALKDEGNTAAINVQVSARNFISPVYFTQHWRYGGLTKALLFFVPSCLAYIDPDQQPQYRKYFTAGIISSPFNADELLYVDHPTELELMSVLHIYGSDMPLKRAIHPSDELLISAVTRNAVCITAVPVQTPELCMAAVKSNGSALQYIDKQTPELCKAAVERNSSAVWFIHDEANLPTVVN